MSVRCELVREALSARIDGETVVVPEQALDEHLASCVPCREWERQAVTLSRQARIAAAPELDDLADRILLAIRGEAIPSRRQWLGVRLALCVIAALQVAIAIPVLVLGHDRDAPLHVSHEMGSWDATLGIALFLATLKPRRAFGMSAMVGIGAVLLCTTALIDLAAGRTSVVDELPHVLSLAGWLLLHRLHVLDELLNPQGPARERPADLTDAQSHDVENGKPIRGLSA